MATSFIFNNKRRILPGAYSTIRSVVQNPPVQSDYGSICIIDTGIGAGFGGGSGISGTITSGKDAVYVFDDLQSFREYMKGSMLWLLAEPLFNPARGSNGITRIYYVRAATTVQAVITFSPTGGGAAGGVLALECRDEGIVGNGVQSSSLLTNGYAATLSVGEVDPEKFIFSLWVGTYKGVAADGLPYDGILATETKAKLVAKSVEFSTMAELIAWANADQNLNNLFRIKTQTVTGTGVVTAADIILYPGNILASGGTEVYNSADVDLALEAVKDLAFSFFLADKYGDNAQGTQNTKIQEHILNTARFEKFMVVGGGLDALKFTQTDGSIPTAQYFNSDKVIVCHGGVKKKDATVGTGFRNWPAIYKAAVVLGRICGLPPQVPVTFKNLAIDGELHQLTDKGKEECLRNGVLATYFDTDNNLFQVLQGVNTLQNNDYLLNSDGTTFSIQLRRITSQINRELEVNIKKDLLNDPNGVNRSTLSAAYLQDYIIGYLQSRSATTTQDNLLISFRNVTVTRNQDAYFCEYELEANTEITKVFITGLLSI